MVLVAAVCSDPVQDVVKRQNPKGSPESNWSLDSHTSELTGGIPEPNTAAAEQVLVLLCDDTNSTQQVQQPLKGEGCCFAGLFLSCNGLLAWPQTCQDPCWS